jgi:hypothetical protein
LGDGWRFCRRIVAASLPLRAHLFPLCLALLGVRLTQCPHLVVALSARGAAGLALLRILLAPGAPLGVPRLAFLALLRVLPAPCLHPRPAFLEAGLDLVAVIGLLGAPLLDPLPALIVPGVGLSGEHDGHGGD